MARKSAKNKDGTPDKPVSTRKSTRTTRRRKKSTSESEPEMEIPVKKESKREEKPETSDAHTRLRRSARTKNTPEVEVVVKPVEEKPEKEEDDTIWESQPTKVDENEPKENNEGEGASTWKVQSSNGSGGEIQKLKICRQRLTDSAESSSSPTKETLSPRKKRYTKRATKDKHEIEDAESTGSHTDSEHHNVEAAQQPQAIPEPEAEPEPIKESKPESKQEEVPSEEIISEVQTEEIQIEEIETEKAVENIETIEQTPVVEEAVVEEVEKKEPEPVKAPIQEEIVEETEIIAEVQESPVVQPEEKKEEVESKSAEPEAKPQLELTDEMEEIAKKLNERAAAKGVKENEEKVDQKPPEVDIESSREEGEIVSEAPTPEAPAKIKPTIIVNKPEVKPKPPTALKRLVDDVEPSSQRKRRTSKAAKPQKETQISISSTTLKNLVPDVTPVPLEEVKEILIEKHGSPLRVGSERKRGHRDSSEEPGELISESGERSPSPEPKKASLEPSKISDRRKSSQDEEKAKEPKKKIVIKHKDDTPNNQENHKATRKISIVTDDAKVVRKSPSPPTKKPSNVLFITNLVRPFTVPQLKELLARTGTMDNNGFYIDKIKSKCYVKYTELDMAVETRQALHGVRWPVNNPKTLKVDFSTEQNLNAMLRLAEEEHNAAIKQEAAAIDRSDRFEKIEKEIIKPPIIEKSITKATSRKVSSIREWDMGKNENQPPNQVEDKKNDEWAKGKERKDTDVKRRAHSPAEADTPRKMKKKDQAAPAKLLDGLFKKTKAAPCIYWLPLTTAQIAVKEEMRRQHMAEHERRLAQAEQRKTEMRRTSKRRDSKEGIRERDRERDRERERERERNRNRK